jgi:carbamoyl-phosphate synthase large subunit
VQELAAAVQGIEAQLHGELRVKPLQEHARDLDLYGRGQQAVRDGRAQQAVQDGAHS